MPASIFAARRGFSVPPALECKYNPDQPRLPAGQPGGGQFAGAQGLASDVSAARKIPPREPSEDSGQRSPKQNLPNIPKERPLISATRTAIVKAFGDFLKGVSGAGLILDAISVAEENAKWLQEYHYAILSYRDPPKSLQELQRARKSGAGTDLTTL